MKRSHLAAGAVALCLGLSACGGSGGDTPAGPDSAAGPMVVDLISDPATLDPAKALYTNEFQLIQAFYDRLLTADEAGTIQGYLASEWEATPTKATVTVAKEPICDDGQPLTVEGMAKSLQRSNEERPTMFGRSKAKITADAAARTITIEVTEANPDLLKALAIPSASLVCPAGLANPDQLATQPVGSGPFVLANAVKGSHYNVTARPEYSWAPDALADRTGSPQAINYQVVSDGATRANRIVAGETNVIMSDGPSVTRLQADPNLTAKQALAQGSEGLMFNHLKDLPTADPAVRRAIAMVINRADYIQALYSGQAEEATTLITANMGCQSSNGGLLPAYDEAAARQVLQDAGYTQTPDGTFAKGGKALTVRILSTESDKTAAEYLQAQFAKIGIASTISAQASAAWQDQLYNQLGSWDVAIMGFSTLMGTPASQIGKYFSGSHEDGNVGSIENAEFEAKRTAAFNASTEDSCAAWVAAEAELLKEVDVLPLETPLTYWFGRGATFNYQGSGGTIDPLSLRLGDQ
ncbi:ABC transporter substrate-binding protein [Naumannella huperziae]